MGVFNFAAFAFKSKLHQLSADLTTIDGNTNSFGRCSECMIVGLLFIVCGLMYAHINYIMNVQILDFTKHTKLGYSDKYPDPCPK